MYVQMLKDVATGAAAGVVAITALPLFGAAGTITAAGATVGAIVGGCCALADNLVKKK